MLQHGALSASATAAKLLLNALPFPLKEVIIPVMPMDVTTQSCFLSSRVLYTIKKTAMVTPRESPLGRRALPHPPSLLLSTWHLIVFVPRETKQ